MRMTVRGQTAGGHLTGKISNSPMDACTAFCNAYRDACRQLIAGDGAIEPVVIAGPWPMDEQIQMRRVYDSEEQPEIAATAGRTLGYAAPPDTVVLFPLDSIAAISEPDTLRIAAIFDAASAEADSTESLAGLGWTQSEIMRAVIAVRMIRSAEAGGAISSLAARTARQGVTAAAMRGLINILLGDPNSMNGHAILVSRAPGVVAFLVSSVDDAWSADPLALPCDPFDAADAAIIAINARLAERTDGLLIAA